MVRDNNVIQKPVLSATLKKECEASEQLFIVIPVFHPPAIFNDE